MRIMAPIDALDRIMKSQVGIFCLSMVFVIWLIIQFYNSPYIKEDSYWVRLVIPDALQELEPVLQCGPRYYKREFGDRGDLSGKFLTLGYGTTASKEQIESTYDLAAISEAVGAQYVVVTLQDGDNEVSGCLTANITAYIGA